MASGIIGKSLGGTVSRLALAVGLAAAVSSGSQAQQPAGQIQIGTSFDCSRPGTGQSIPTLVCQTPELQFADLHQMQAYYTLRHAQPQRQQELRNQFTARIQALVRECSTEQVRASNTQPTCVAQALGNLRAFWLEQLQQTGNAAALEESRLPSGNLVGAQQALKTSGFLPANAVVDGVYGSATRDAITRFQSERGIAPTGFLTPPTLVALRRASIAGTGPAGAPAAANSAASPPTPTPPPQRTASTPQAAQPQPAQRPQATLPAADPTDRTHEDNTRRISEIDRIWQSYQNRNKTVLEQVFNYHTTGNVDGMQDDPQPREIVGFRVRARDFWISGHNGSHQCAMTRMVYSIIGNEVVELGSIDLSNSESYIREAFGRSITALAREMQKLPASVHAQRNSIFTSQIFDLSIRGITVMENRVIYPQNQIIDIRTFNQTAFRISSRPFVPQGSLRDLLPGMVSWVAGDERLSLRTVLERERGPEMDRLRNAWGLAFQECPGRRSAF